MDAASSKVMEEATAELVRGMRTDEVTRLRSGFRAADLVGVRGIVEDLRRIMFPGFFDEDPPWDTELEAHVSRLCRRVSGGLKDEVRRVLRYGRRRSETGVDRGAERDAEMWSVPPGPGGGGRSADEGFVEESTRAFIASLPRVRAMLALDVQAAYDGDPAAEHTDEIVLCYPGLDAIFTHRVAHELYKLGVPVLPRVISEHAHSRTGIDIHPGAQIGERFFVDHGSATVIGETSVIGKQVKIYQGVTLGARSFPKDERGRAIRGIKRHPTIGDRVAIYAGAVILGGDTVIGDDCVIAGGVFVTSSVPPGHVVQQTRPELVLKPSVTKEKGARREAKSGGVDLGWLGDGAGI